VSSIPDAPLQTSPKVNPHFHPKKILAIKLRSLGDTVLMTAPIAELRRAFPRAEIHAVTLTQWAPLLDRDPAIDKVWTYERYSETAARAKAAARLALKLRREAYDCVVNFHASPSSSMIAFATGAKVRSIHFHGHAVKNRYSTVVVPDKGKLKPIIERDMDTVRALGIEIPEGRMPRLHVRPQEMDQAAELAQRLGLNDPILAIGLGSSRPTKSWPLLRYAELAVRWAETAGGEGGSALALGSPAELGLIEEFLSAVDSLHPSPEVRARITGVHHLSVRELAAMLKYAAVFVGNDSGPKHIAVAVGAPTVTLFGPEHPFEWHPYPLDRHPRFFVENLACRTAADPGMPPWCGLETCEVEMHRCMTQIQVDAVLAECRRVYKL
jgi:ADP-heptose:LPS heptosyltransferase